MFFNPGDLVVHHSFGVGTIASIEGMNFNGKEPKQFYRVEFSRTTVWVPVDKMDARGLRPITPKSELYRFQALLKSAPVLMDTDFRSRQNEIENRVESGSFQALCEIVRDLSALSFVKPLSNTERSIYNQARSSLASEWSVTSEMAVDKALEEIDRYLCIGRSVQTDVDQM